MRRRHPDATDEVRRAPWWAQDRRHAVGAYWRWVHRRWLVSPAGPASVADRYAQRYRRICVALHGIDPADERPPPGMAPDGRITNPDTYRRYLVGGPRVTSPSRRSPDHGDH